MLDRDCLEALIESCDLDLTDTAAESSYSRLAVFRRYGDEELLPVTHDIKNGSVQVTPSLDLERLFGRFKMSGAKSRLEPRYFMFFIITHRPQRLSLDAYFCATESMGNVSDIGNALQLPGAAYFLHAM